MDHKNFLKTLPAQTNINLHRITNGPGLRALVLHGGLIVALATMVALRVPLWPLLMLPLGIALAFTFTLQHECTHRTPFASAWLNEAVGHACALILLQPFAWFRAFHMAHHRFTNDPDRDPELQGEAKPESWRAMAWHLSCVSYWRDKLVLLARNAFGNPASPHIPPRAHARLRREARLLITAYMLCLLSLTVTPLLLTIWLIPLALGFPVLRLYLLAEHGRCAHVPDMFRNTRTVLTTPLIRLLAWNMPWHAEHHTMPNVPFHRLSDLHALIRSHLVEVEDGYASFARHYTDGFSDP
ncbi:fatty acid desaturase [Aliiroseovarius subalbicans]|uniref:fatty acid desaturase n=1 Tax=Aliiroseovarius subalbicans TaxID=2925840 RepID=UPI001F581BE8|nr:fatty acid desaturase [Aliiroseovarius subalbicans]MCI2398311.1 fatty acid desaturase [Aliiroseovarius subalbicans]